MLNNPSCFFSFVIALCVLLEEGLGHPSADSHLPSANGRHLRTKRCSCINWMDKECIYFCHLDIIWINTSSHSVPYGLGSPRKRKKRSLHRCECSHLKDSICATFCYDRSRNLRNVQMPLGKGVLAKVLQSRGPRSQKSQGP